MKVELDRFIAAILASNWGMKIDFSDVARFYGRGATRNTIEHKIRGFRKMAEALRAEIDGPHTPNKSASISRKRSAGSQQTSTDLKSKRAKSGTGARIITDLENSKTFIDIDEEEITPIKTKIKQDNHITRSLLGIKTSPFDDLFTVLDDQNEGIIDHVKNELDDVDITTIPSQLPSLQLETDFHFDSQKNGYDLSLPSSNFHDPMVSSKAYGAAFDDEI
ncbi:hypothetical protein N7462_008987 [Penicillium macrosclerotiorum]|uniref:uncharacterized protein n=1 Tax=Penicillium macrosclerotiorum TaxID=303699 RepID=UPI00254820B1|nr:uncharacterized protein N7462_008987 [Penicillium macrosclerotiorum]KAJ5676090.1 hypothetical protein N7462_008987 [Penicillium macrosclerotiorum]